MCFLHGLPSPGIEESSARRLRAANSCFVKGFAPEQHHFVRALLREHASFDNRLMLSHFMVQMVELIELRGEDSLCGGSGGTLRRVIPQSSLISRDTSQPT